MTGELAPVLQLFIRLERVSGELVQRPIGRTAFAASSCSTKSRGRIEDGDCPTVYRTDRGTIGVQGYLLDRATPDCEALVEIPAELLLEAARALGG